ncbi:uncharacterized protein SPAPADRAFT_58525 [Spathaspora passalidarum NRRL Y-27907]|uniref:Uncharacterized protein n=1 Tax=Spathaspora passalidarum (strain NRRL Y-27907 / 11-Y1) TaxID=619300 RepID=G3AGG5_SPAPN|nr:uncharacterized protein SPAPADRAFT_58525 [Spathaspora passalidarum NRRL Y-27907]EGW35304.1 hypothetical protein SPAPADRAFT_58525 [Spathaspora passalidarum NRRL Y-27907]
MRILYIISLVCLLVFGQAQVLEEALWDLSSQVDDYVHSNFGDNEIQAYEQFMDLVEGGTGQLNGLEKRANFEPTIEEALKAFNSSGILWTLLDSLANHPNRVDTVANFTYNFLKGRKITIKAGSLINSLGNVSSIIDVPAILNAVIDSGIVQSLLDGILLDKSFQPKLVNIEYNLIMSQKDTLKYLFQELLQKREVEEDWYIKRADNDGTLVEFFENAAATLFNSPSVGEFARDTLNALNDTGFLVYTVKRFIGNEKYLNMTGALISSVVRANVIHIDFSGINITRLAQQFLKNPTQVLLVVEEFLQGKYNLNIGDSLSKYADAIGANIKALEDKGLFRQLNDYIFEGKDSVSGKDAKSDDQESSDSASTESKSSSGAVKITNFKLCLSLSLIVPWLLL